MPSRRSTRRKYQPRSGSDVIQDVLRHAHPRPDRNDAQQEKTKYATRFAERLAELIADDLDPLFPGVEAASTRNATAVDSRKQLDIHYSTPQLGLGLGISLKSVHIRDRSAPFRYTHNMKRNEEELRIEASAYHKRQPYAVMIGVLALPFDSCTDGKNDNPSSFASWVRKLRPYTGRRLPTDENDKFEKLYVALYDPAGHDLSFFDIESDPPKNSIPVTGGSLHVDDSRPQRLLNYEEFLDAVRQVYLRRNTTVFRWSDGWID